MTAPRWLSEQTWPDVDADATVAVPVGSLEQHGPHLPLDTDTAIATAVAVQLPNVLVAPPIAYGASGEHQSFAGTVSIGLEALEVLLLEYGRSVCTWTGRAVFVNGHGGNAGALVKAVQRLRFEGRDVVWLPCVVPNSDAHAGRTETSLLLHLAPDRVRLDRAVVGATEPIGDLMPRLRERGVAGVSASGVLGDPTGATPAEGRQLYDALVTRSAAAVNRWSPDTNGMLR
ncbi:mycofactocin biosynthesis peptidyl-dipeptidase MftE [Antrihabitans cavernicola]|uniref:Mycofactocin biosynthesis peptidyl-dipeptidase MftE n=1 Tax=Antrihabitans cavernicola TaxID=2495913 RepID=A0A5A7S6U1_9NOCA|nr:mycofactocin biosynthesis peptidyl-dipeptidase MftE [Spelaeibacter cavernicola]KAA0018386.1 mycofactocin biosynthesis peptidyl-dipeptidase MftE [Spelaeibacter cavernicola]